MFRKSEWFPLIVSILVMGFALGFDDGQDVLVLGFWFSNLIMVTLMVGFSFILHQIAHKIVARAEGFDTEYQFWGINSFKFWRLRDLMGKGKDKPFPRKVRIFGKEYLIKSFPIGIVLALFLTLLSNGLLFFLAVGQYALLLKKSGRFGRKFVEVTDYEEAKIALAGPMMHVILMVIAKFFNGHGTFDTFIFINAALALFYMIPFSQLDGTKVYFGSRLMYVSSLVFIVSMVVLVYNVTIIPMLIISAIAAIVAFGLYYYYRYYS